MWTREALKSRAKDVLRGNYWTAFVVSLVLVFVSSDGGSGSSNAGTNYSTNNSDTLIRFLPIILVVVLIFLALSIFVFYNLEVGGRRFFVRAAEGKSDIGYLGSAFSDGQYLPIIGTMFLKDIFILLWTLLLIIPGIVKSYAYRFVPYILADNPEIGASRAIELSNEMTRGHKWSMFVLDLSFIGWYLLGLLALGIGVLFVKPYENATMAELYLVLRKNSLDDGSTSYRELNMETPEVVVEA